MGRRRASGFTLVELLVVIVIIALLAALLLPAIIRALCNARQGGAQQLIDNLQQATKMYETDFGVYPAQSGTSTNSGALAKALKSTGPKKQAYFEFQPGSLEAGSEDILSPIRSGDELSYRNNKNNPPNAAAKNKQSFDIWCPDCNNIADGVNNWGGK